MQASALIRKSLLTVALIVCVLGVMAGTVGCDEGYTYAGDFMTPSVAPADFSPYGYDYDMYDLFTEDI